MKKIPPLQFLQYSRAHTYSIEALHTLCCSSGTLRERLSKVDSEFFSLVAKDYPEYGNIQSLVAELRALVTRYEPKSQYSLEGRIAASIEQSHYSKRTRMAQLVWEIHRELTAYMQSEA